MGEAHFTDKAKVKYTQFAICSAQQVAWVGICTASLPSLFPESIHARALETFFQCTDDGNKMRNVSGRSRIAHINYIKLLRFLTASQGQRTIKKEGEGGNHQKHSQVQN